MEVKHVPLIKVYFLVMNDMRERANIQKIAAIATSSSGRLVEYYNSQESEPYEVKQEEHHGPQVYTKVFKEGALEWCNPLRSFDPESHPFGFGIYEEWFDVPKLMEDNIPYWVDREEELHEFNLLLEKVNV